MLAWEEHYSGGKKPCLPEINYLMLRQFGLYLSSLQVWLVSHLLEIYLN